MQLPLRLQLKASRFHCIFLASGHSLAGMAVCLLGVPVSVKLILLACISLLFLRFWHLASRQLPQFLLQADGKLVLIQDGCEPSTFEVGPDTLVWPWVVVLHLQSDKSNHSQSMLIFSDGVAGEGAHRHLRLWLRWRIGQVDAVNSGAGE